MPGVKTEKRQCEKNVRPCGAARGELNMASFPGRAGSKRVGLGLQDRIAGRRGVFRDLNARPFSMGAGRFCVRGLSAVVFACVPGFQPEPL